MERYKEHDIEIVIDRIPAGIDLGHKDNRLRLSEAVDQYKASGFDVLLEPLTKEAPCTVCAAETESQCRICFEGHEDQYKLIFTRPVTGGARQEEDLF